MGMDSVGIKMRVWMVKDNHICMIPTHMGSE